ncbi:MAG: DUF1302 domain-containing protein [Proteobacteria bacterium]|nr:DUF1302 domain-containing protein [Pseudomonadota bacterium]
MKNLTERRGILFLGAMVFAVMSFFGSAEAMTFEPNDDTKIDCDVTLSWAGGVRVEDRDLNTKAMKDVNANDGGWNFEQWDMTNNRWTAIADIDVQYKKVGVFARPRAFYDFVYMGDNSNPGLDKHWSNNNYLAGAISKPDKFDSAVKDIMGTETQFLDYFFYSNFSLGGHPVDFRAGQQVIACGEQLFLPGGVASAMSYADLTAANIPGVELKEVYMPSESASLRMDILNNLTAMGFYQWEWEHHIFNQPGSYYSDMDLVGEAGRGVILPSPYPPYYAVAPRGKDQLTRDDGQYGLGFIYRAERLAQTEFGFYYINYHEKSPLIHLVVPPLVPPTAMNYYFSYPEDVKLYGMSVSTFINGVSLSGEFTYRNNFPLSVRGVYEDCNMVQGQMAALYTLGENPIFDDVALAGEIGFNKVLGVDGEDMTSSDYSWGYSISVTPKYYQVLTDLDMNMPISYKGNPAGNSPNKTFTEGADSASIGVTLVWRSVYKMELKYVEYFNPYRSGLADRDFIGMNLKYTF